MKYIDTEKLIAEIERRKEKWLLASRLVRKGKDKAMYAAGKSSAYTEFLSLITSLHQEQPSEALERAAEKYADGIIDREDAFMCKTAFIAGARWQKEQMMKEAVDGEAHPDDCEIWCNLVGYGYKFKAGDKVKLIIVKED